MGFRPSARLDPSGVLATLALLVWLVWVGLGLTVLQSSAIGSGPTLTVTVVQSNVPQSNKMAWSSASEFFEQQYLDWLDMRDLTERAAETHPDLIVWPETMFSGSTLDPESIAVERESGLYRELKSTNPRVAHLEGRLDDTRIADELLVMQRALGIPMLVGAPGRTGLSVTRTTDGRVQTEWGNEYNSVYLLEGGKVTGPRYDKIRLMAFGEVMPYVWRWPWLQQRLLDLGAEGMSFTLTPGKARTVFEVPMRRDFPGPTVVRIVTPVCFEATMPDLCRSLVYQKGKRRADVMVNPSNDGWFGSSVAMREHYLRAARWRCVELGTPMVRACNTGISAVINADGTIEADSLTAPPGARALEAGILNAGVLLPSRETLYGRTGDVFGSSAAILTGMIVGWGLIGRRKKTVPAESRAGQSVREE